MSRSVGLAGGVFKRQHDALVGVAIDASGFDLDRIAPERRRQAQATWQERVRSEYRSAQLMTRLLADVLAAGDPLDVTAGIVEAIEDELRHVSLCCTVVRALGATPLYPEPLEVKEHDRFLAMQPSERALATAIGMLLVSETLSVGYIRDLAARCQGPVVRDVLAATLADEGTHDSFGWTYVERALGRFPVSTLGRWRAVAAQAIDAQRLPAEQVLSRLTAAERKLERYPEPDLAELGLFSKERQALVFVGTYEETLAPRLRALSLL